MVNKFLQLVPEFEDFLTAFLLTRMYPGDSKKKPATAPSAWRSSIKGIVGIQIAVDEQHTVSGTSSYIQPPVGIGVLVGFHFL